VVGRHHHWRQETTHPHWRQETTHARDRGCDRTTQQLWVALEEKLLGNREARTLHLDKQFQLFVHGDLSIDDYCHRMKRMADDLGEHVEDRTLVLQVLRGLNKKYDHIKTYLKRAWPFPSFHDVRNDLLLEELTLDVEASSGSATALAALGRQQQQSSPTPAQQCRPLSSPAPFGSSGGGGGDGRRRRNRSGGGGGGSGTTTPTSGYSKLSNRFSYVIFLFIYRMVELDIVLLYIRSRV
jgi:hypothetical protein